MDGRDEAIAFILEQAFSLRLFADQVQQMFREQVKTFLIEQHQQMMLQRLMYQELLQQEWKLALPFASS